MPTSVIPQASAVRIASAVGAETAMTMPAPMAAVFWTISTEIRLVSTTAPEGPQVFGGSQCARKFVERIVPPDILAHHHAVAARHKEPRRMRSSRFAIEGLRRRQPFDGQPDLFRCEADRACHRRDDPARLLQAFDAAEPATGRSDEAPLPFLQRPAAVRTQPDAQFDSCGARDNVELLDLADIPDDAFGQAEAQSQIGQVGGRCHEHSRCRSVVDKSNGTFLGHRARVARANWN